jgi:hypothetical protein
VRKSGAYTFEKIETTLCRQPMNTTIRGSAEAQLLGSLAKLLMMMDRMMHLQTQNQSRNARGCHHITGAVRGYIGCDHHSRLKARPIFRPLPNLPNELRDKIYESITEEHPTPYVIFTKDCWQEWCAIYRSRPALKPHSFRLPTTVPHCTPMGREKTVDDTRGCS